MTKIKNNPYLDLNYIDRTREIEARYEGTVRDVKRDPDFYAELVNDLMFHYVYGTRETPLMIHVKNHLITDGKR